MHLAHILCVDCKFTNRTCLCFSQRDMDGGAWGDVSGREFDLGGVARARHVEMDYFEKM